MGRIIVVAGLLVLVGAPVVLLAGIAIGIFAR